jgi:hypothetical protein
VRGQSHLRVGHSSHGGDCLLATIRDFDTRVDDRTEQAWRRVVQQAIDFMTARY